MAHADKSAGVAPAWVAVDITSTDWTPPAGKTFIGFRVNGAGNVTVVSNGNSHTVAVASGASEIGEFSQITRATTTATGIIAYVI